jgi:hypothetical protein
MSKHDMVVASWNIKSFSQGVQGVRWHFDICNFFRKAVPQLKVILLQEHHMKLQDCLKKISQIDFKGGVSFWNNALYTAKFNQFKGGTAIIVSVRLAPLIEKHGVFIGQVGCNM